MPRSVAKVAPRQPPRRCVIETIDPQTNTPRAKKTLQLQTAHGGLLWVVPGSFLEARSCSSSHDRDCLTCSGFSGRGDANTHQYLHLTHHKPRHHDSGSGASEPALGLSGDSATAETFCACDTSKRWSHFSGAPSGLNWKPQLLLMTSGSRSSRSRASGTCLWILSGNAG